MDQGTQSVFQKGHAVIVGIGTPDISATQTDANGLFDLLTDLGRCAYPATQVNRLTCASATKTNILAALDDLATACAKDSESTAILF